MPDDAATIIDIVKGCRRVHQFVDSVDQAAFKANVEKRWAVVSQLLIIGEAARRLSQAFRDQHADIPWRRLAAMRNRLIHEYDKINWELVWRTATTEVPRLQAELEPLVRVDNGDTTP